MNALLSSLGSLRSDAMAVTALESGLIAGVLVVTITVGFNILGSGLDDGFITISDAFN